MRLRLIGFRSAEKLTEEVKWKMQTEELWGLEHARARHSREGGKPVRLQAPDGHPLPLPGVVPLFCNEGVDSPSHPHTQTPFPRVASGQTEEMGGRARL